MSMLVILLTLALNAHAPRTDAPNTHVWLAGVNQLVPDIALVNQPAAAVVAGENRAAGVSSSTADVGQ